MKNVSTAVLSLMLAATVAVVVGVSVRTAAQPAAPIDLLQVLPDGNGVIVVDVQRVLTSSLFSQEKLKGLLAKAQGEVAQLGFNMTDVRTAAIAFPSAKFNDPTVAVTGTFNQADILARLRDNSKVKLASEKYKGLDVHTVTETGKTTSMAFVFLDAETVVGGQLTSVRAAIDVRGGEKPGISGNAKLMDALAQNAASPIRFALVMSPEVTKGLESSGLPLPNFSSINLIFGGLDLASNVALNATLRNNTAENAKAMADQLNSLFSMVKGLLGGSNDPKMAPIVEAIKTVSIVNTDIDVKITGSVPVDLIGQIIR